MTEQRDRSTTGILRRDFNDLVRDQNGQVSEAKAWANVGKGIAAYLLIEHTQYIVDRWDALITLLCILVLPDMLKKIITMKYGGNGTPKQVEAK